MIGTQLSHFRITAKLGEGGMGEVYRAEDTKLGREVAIKVLPEAVAGDPERLARFEREAKVLAALDHGNIAAIYSLESATLDIGEGRLHFLVMQLAEGEDLAQRLVDGPLPIDETLPIALQIAEALEAAHERGIIHRDLKPANIKATPDGQVKILDFGLAKALDPADTTSGKSILSPDSPTLTAQMTQAGVLLGTAAYMSPEQARGQPADKRADIWAFGCVLFEMLAGQKVFSGDTATDVIAAVVTRDPDWQALPAATPAAVRRLLSRCLAKDPKLRLHDIADARLELLSAGEPEIADEPTAIPPGRRWPWASLAAVALLAGLLGFVVGRGSGPPTSSETAAATPSTATTAVTQVTDHRGAETFGTLSPDGSFVAYNARDGGDLDILLLRSGGRNPINLTEASEADDYQPAFSPDGATLAFRSDRDGGGIFVMGATGESTRRLTRDGYHPAWSPDGARIVYCEDFFVHPNDRNITSSLWVVDVESGESRQIFAGDAVQPSWSPNGERIAFWGLYPWESGRRNIATVPAAGGEPVWITESGNLDWSPVWSPDGRFLYFSSDRGGTMNVWRVPIDESSGEPMAQPQPVPVPARWAGFLAVARSSPKLLFTSYNNTEITERVRIDLANRRLVGSTEVVRASLAVDRVAALSPDGEWIALSSKPDQMENLFVLRSDGSDLRQLTSDSFKDRGPSWSADGSRILFYSDRSGRYDIWSLRPDGSELTQWTETTGRSLWNPALSPDESKLSVFNETGTMVFELSGELPARNPVPLPDPDREGTVFFGDAWSPDGDRLAGNLLQLPATIPVGVAVYSLSSNGYQALLDLPPGHSAPQWTPDGDRLLFVGHDGALQLFDPSTGALEEVASLPAEPPFFRLRGMSTNFDWLLLRRSDQQSDLYLATLE